MEARGTGRQVQAVGIGVVLFLLIGGRLEVRYRGYIVLGIIRIMP